MRKEKQQTDFARWVICILIALAVGAYLGAPIHSETKEAGPAAARAGETAEEAGTEKADAKGEKSNGETGGTKGEQGSETADKSGVEMTSEQLSAESLPDYTDSAANVTQPEYIDSAANAAQPEYVLLSANRGGAANRKEIDVLVHLINAEAYGLSYKAKLAVGQVVMNRWTGPYYGNDLLAIMTAPHQFTPIYNGSAYKKKIEPDSIRAANAVLSGTGVKELTDDTYYFVNPDFTTDKTIETKMEFVCEIEGMHFFKPPTK